MAVGIFAVCGTFVLQACFRYNGGRKTNGGIEMDNIAARLKAYTETHPFDPGDSGCETVLDQLYQA